MPNYVSRLLITVSLWMSLGCAIAQSSLVEIQWDAYRDRKVTTLSGMADMVPTSDAFGIFNFASVRLAKVDLRSGAVVAEFDDGPLDRFCADFVAACPDTTISLYDDETILRTPTCQRHIYIYKHLYQVPGSTDVVCEISATLRQPDREDYPFYQLELIVRLTMDLEVCSIHIREKDRNFSDGGSDGGAVVNDSTLVLTYKNRVKGVPAHYIYKLVDDAYVCVAALSPLSHQEEFPWYEVSRFPAAYLQLGNSIYSTNGKVVIRKDNLFAASGDTLDFPLDRFESLSYLCSMEGLGFIGIKGIMGQNDYDNYILFYADENFEEYREIGKYSEETVDLNSLSTLGDFAYILFFDPKQRRILLHKVNLSGGLPSRKFAFTN